MTKTKGKTWDEAAASSPIAVAVAPLKSDAQERAAKSAQAYIDDMVKAMEAGGWDLTKVAPRPDSMRTSRKEYKEQMARHNVFASLTASGPTPEGEKPWPYKGKPDMRQRNPEAEAAFIAQVRASAAVQYDAFVAKLVLKVGDCITAQLEGNHVWGHSILTVRKAIPGGHATERWKTQCILNVSCLGTLFNQWPTRKLK